MRSIPARQPVADNDPAGRVFDHARMWQLTEPAFEAAARMLAAAEPAPDMVVGIARGGMPLARFLGARFGVPVLEIRARHNCGDDPYAAQAAEVSVTGGLPADHRPGRAVLVADDICGTGQTFRAVLPEVERQLRPACARTVALCRNAGASFTPDAWIWDTRDWVVFPWNPALPGQAESLVLPPAVRGKETL